MVQPFLFRFRQKCTTKGDFDGFAYDEELEMVTKNNRPVVYCPELGMPATKKSDIEVGEDAKDSMMWH